MFLNILIKCDRLKGCDRLFPFRENDQAQSSSLRGRLKRFIRRIMIKLDFALPQIVLTQHYEEQNSSFLILDFLVMKKFDKDSHD